MTTCNMSRWKGKVAFVTGANGGIGMAITKRLLDLDFAVVAVDKQTDQLVVSTRILKVLNRQLARLTALLTVMRKIE